MKRIFSIILALVMIAMTVPMTVSVSAETLANGIEYSIGEEEVTVTGYSGSATELVIPKNIEGYPVTAIAWMAFAGYLNLGIWWLN